MFSLPKLPYAYDALTPVISERTMKFHHDKHHGTYVKTVNELLETSGARMQSLEDVIRDAAADGDKKLFNNAAQAWNHAFFWPAMTAKPEQPEGDLAEAIEKAFGGLDALKDKFVTEGAGHFGSGWVWLVADRSGALSVRATHDADDTLTKTDITPLLVCDLWEHAYYLDHQNDRKGFLEAWFDALPHWDFARYQLKAARGEGEPWRHPAPDAGAAERKHGATR
ncbi:MAG TPA: superoxide dismutase [Caulobacteraceae bacterium]|nr:superoxide dismutase [Caulobacteraceae bacterium]